MSPSGEWQVQFDYSGIFVAWHRAQDGREQYGPLQLSFSDSGALWQCVDALNLQQMESPTRPPVPDEGEYTLTMQMEKDYTIVHVLRNDALRIPAGSSTTASPSARPDPQNW